MSNGERWTKESMSRLRMMAAIGFTYKMAANEFGRTRSAVAGKAASLGIKFKGRGERRKQDLETRIRVGDAVRTARMERQKALANNVHSITAEFCGDPVPGRSALDGWQQRGQGYCDPSNSESTRGLKRRRDIGADE